MLLRNLYLTIPVIHSFIFVTSGCQGQPGGSIWVALDWEPAHRFLPGNRQEDLAMPSHAVWWRQSQSSLWMHASQFHCQKQQRHHANTKRSHSITWPLTGAVSVTCGCITPKFNDNNFIASDSVGQAFKQGSAGWLVSVPCGVSLGGSTVNEGSNVGSLLCAACHLGSLISPLHGLSSSRASLFPCGVLAG